MFNMLAFSEVADIQHRSAVFLIQQNFKNNSNNLLNLNSLLL